LESVNYALRMVWPKIRNAKQISMIKIQMAKTKGLWPMFIDAWILYFPPRRENLSMRLSITDSRGS
jgi:hypothetical protein